jgi:arylsulfatase A-like enzyme
MGDLRKTLADAGIEDDTLIIFTSDHGDMIYSNGWQRKQKPWDESIRVPMVWHWPGGLGREGKKVDGVMSSEDVMPTILGLCGVTAPKTVEGLDYAAYMKGGENPNAGNAALISCVTPFSEWSRAMGGREYRGVRTPRYTYVRQLNGPWLLYDNEKDPYQKDNLVGKGLPVESELDSLLQDKLKSARDEFKDADYYLTKWGYKDRLRPNGALPTEP